MLQLYYCPIPQASKRQRPLSDLTVFEIVGTKITIFDNFFYVAAFPILKHASEQLLIKLLSELGIIASISIQLCCF